MDIKCEELLCSYWRLWFKILILVVLFVSKYNYGLRVKVLIRFLSSIFCDYVYIFVIKNLVICLRRN